MRYLLFSIILGCVQVICCVLANEQTLNIKSIVKFVRDSFPEPVFIMSILYLVKVYCNYRIARWLIRLLGLLYIVVFFSECYYYSISGEWISLLALANLNQAYLLVDMKYLPVLLVIIAFLLFYLFCIDFKEYSKPTQKFLAVIIILMITSFGTILYLLPKKVVPLSSLVYSYYQLYKLFANNNVRIGYPFEKDYIYQIKFPCEKVRNDNPNIVLIFTEGTSARLIGSYNKKYETLTPNIDSFAKQCMQVNNYYNHTAATFRGTFGQLASAFSMEGGWNKGGWVLAKNNPQEIQSLKRRNVQTLPKLLNSEYNTVFLSPHKKEDPYTDLLENLGFSTIYTLEDINHHFLNDEAKLFCDSIKDEDMYLSLQRFMEKYKQNKPFFISMYTLDTHTGIGLPKGAEKFGHGPGNVESLNSLHHLDKAFGTFWKWFTHSDYKNNTIIIFTSDHAHYQDKSYVNIVKNDSDYKRVFIDRIPLLIYDPTHVLPKTFDANDRTSLDLTPTICHMLEKQGRNGFLGNSIFEKSDSKIGIAAEGITFYGIYDHRVWHENEISASLRTEFEKKRNKVLLFYKCLKANQVLSVLAD